MDKSASMTHARQLVQQALPSHCRTCCVPGRSERVSLAEGRWEAALVILKEVRSDTMCGPSSYVCTPLTLEHQSTRGRLACPCCGPGRKGLGDQV